MTCTVGIFILFHLFNGFMEQQNKTVMHNGTELRDSLLSCTKALAGNLCQPQLNCNNYLN